MSTIPTTRESFRELLHNAGIHDILRLSPDEDFLAEVAFLNHWNAKLAEETGIDGYRLCENTSNSYDGVHSITIILEHGSGERVAFIYALNDSHPGQHSLIIMRDGQAIYSRRAFQDPATEWDVNYMAGDPAVTDDNGNMLFIGNPVNI